MPLRVSICIPCYKRPDLAKEAIESALNQSPPPYEILIGDDSPDDLTRQMVDAIDAGATRIRYWKHAPSLGQARNVQFLLERAQGELLSIMHDDDRFRPDALATLCLGFEQHPEIILSFGKQVIINEAGEENAARTEELNRYFSRTKNGSEVIHAPLNAAIVGMVPSNGFVVRTAEAHKLDYYADNRASKGCDFYFTFRLAQTGKPFFFQDCFASDYRLTAESSARSGTDSGFHAFKIILEDLGDAALTDHTRQYLKGKAKVAIAQAAKLDRQLGLRWYFSKWHRGAIPTVGGIRRLWWLLRG